MSATLLWAQEPAVPTEILPGVWRITLGQPEAITPASTRHYLHATEGLAALPKVDCSPAAVSGQATARGYLVRIPLAPEELIYGLGLQLQSFQQRSLKKRLRVNADTTRHVELLDVIQRLTDNVDLAVAHECVGTASLQIDRMGAAVDGAFDTFFEIVARSAVRNPLNLAEGQFIAGRAGFVIVGFLRHFGQ